MRLRLGTHHEAGKHQLLACEEAALRLPNLVGDGDKDV